MKKENTSKYTGDFLFITYMVFLVSVVFSLRAVSSLSIGLILLTAILRDPKTFRNLYSNKKFFPFFLGGSLLYLIQCISLSYTANISEGLQLLQRRSGLVLIPLAVYSSSNFLTWERFHKIMSYFTVVVSAGGFYCLLVAVFNYYSGSPATTFFYHDLVKPLSQHAIQFSILVFLSLLFQIENLKIAGKDSPRPLSYALIAFLSLFLVLLSSKLIISFYIIYLLCLFFSKPLYRKRILGFFLIFTAIVITLIVTPNPVGYRFRSILAGNSVLFEQKKFDPGIYFNGVQFRLLEWRFTYEILNEQNAWIPGLAPGDAQSFLDRKYIKTDMYTGIPGTSNHGFLGYHTHNQFLQSLLENGLVELALFIFMCYTLFRFAWTTKTNVLKWLVALLIIYCFTDAPFETQYGMVIFIFFPAFLYLGYQNSMRAAQPVLAGFKPRTIPATIKQPN